MSPMSTLAPYTLLSPERCGSFLFSCEHASNALPPDVSVSRKDQHFLDTHWGIDIGAEAVTRHLIELTQSQGILATHSRLWLDLNRSLDRTDLIRLETEGHYLSFNQQVDAREQQRRIDTVYHPFHQAYDALVKERISKQPPVLLISIHSFTPVWDGKVRTMDVGVLFDTCEELGQQLATCIAKQDLFVECNAPYTGRGGLMHSVEDKGRRHQCAHLELEINQALICTPERQRFIAQKIYRALIELEQSVVNF